MKAPEIIADPDYPRLKEHILAHTGLAFYGDKDTDFAMRIAHRLEAHRAPSCAAYLRILRDRQSGAQETDALVAELTIGETYFFRQKEHFDVLRHAVFPDLIERNRASRRLNIWSAGCATGAEAYSVALLVELELAAEVAGWDISIRGTDINRSFLERASAGQFDDWALRASPEELKANCFYREHKRWRLRPEYKRRVSFAYHNLVNDPILVPPGSRGFDLILCRNVMIYFSRERVQTTAERFYEALAPGGWLLVGHAEHNTEVFAAFHTVSACGAVLYQKPLAMEARPQWTPYEAGVASLADFPPAPAVLLHAVPAPAPLAAEPSQSDAVPSPVGNAELEEVRGLADRGQWDVAASRCRRLLEKDALNAAAHFTYGLILEQTGPPEQAEQYLRRALYLDRAFALAQYHLGLCMHRKGAAARARKAFENTVDLLAGRREDEKLEHGDGITVAELRDSAKMHLELLEK